MDYKKIAADILINLGGKQNIAVMAHCATRLRVVLNDSEKLDKKELDENDVVKGYFETGGQHQIILGSGIVNSVYNELNILLEMKEVNIEKTKKLATEKLNPLQRLVKNLSDVFVPILPAIVAGGLLMGINNILTTQGLFTANISIIEKFPAVSDLSSMINTFANAPFVFLPILIAFSATKIFGGNPYLGAALGMLMVHPNLLSGWGYANALAEGNLEYWNILGLRILKIGYQGTVLPILVSSYILSKTEVNIRKKMPSFLDNLLTPLLTLFISGVITFIFVGPIMINAGNFITNSLIWLYEVIGVVGGGIFGFVYAPIVITGMHHSFLAVETQLLADIIKTGGSFIFPIAAMSNIAQGTASIVTTFVTKDKKIKTISLATGLSALLGITEPAMFGVNLKLKYPFYAAIIGSGIAGGFVTLYKILGQSMGAPGLIGIISIKPNLMIYYILGMIISSIVTGFCTYILSIYFEKK
ncbi:MAG: sucrose-specific PTS transporter subunit IIBC [Cetobacterium sp.]